MARREYEGTLVVYRESSMVEHLSADVKLPEGEEELYYYKAPKIFQELITDGTRNCVRVRFTADEDGGRNPRNVVALSEPF